MSENSAVFCAMGSNWPLQKAHPRGAKLPAKIRISAIKGSEIAASLLSRREDPDKRDDVVNAQERNDVVMGPAAPGASNCLRTHRN